MIDLVLIRDYIEKMSKFHQVEVLRILNKHKEVILNENKYGIHINLTELNDDIIEELSTYVNYVNTQELTLKQDEKQKEEFKNTFFS